MPFVQCCAARTVGDIKAAHTWLSGLVRYNCRVERDDECELMGKLVNVALNRGDESLGRVGLPN